MLFFKEIKARTLWIITGVIFAIVVGLIVLLSVVPTEYTRIILVLMVVCFVLLTILVQWASFKSFKFKPKKDPVNPKTFTTDLDIEEVLVKNKYKLRKRDYGNSYLKISKPNAFKVTLVTDTEAYFNPKEVASEPDPELEKCDRMIAFEIFLNYVPEDVDKFSDFSLQGKNVYYTAFYKTKDNEYVCANYLEPVENHKRNYDTLLNELGLHFEGEDSKNEEINS